MTSQRANQVDRPRPSPANHRRPIDENHLFDLPLISELNFFLLGFTCFFFLFDLVLFLFVVVVVVVVVVVGGPFSFCLPSTKKQKIQFDSVRDAIGQSDRSINRFLSTVLCGAGPLRCVSISVGLRSGIVRHLFLAHSGKRPAHLKRWPIKKEKPRRL